MEAGSAGLVIMGSTGESPTLSMDEHKWIIAEAVVHAHGRLPIILYNVPGRTITDLSHDAVLRLAEVPNIVGLKDATGDLGRGASLLRALPGGFRSIAVTMQAPHR